MSESQRFVHAACQVSLGTDRHIEVEVDSSGNVWVAPAKTTAAVDVWMKGVAEALDLRIHIERRNDALVVMLDTGAESGSWWDRTLPRLTVSVGEDGVARVTAAIHSSEGDQDPGTTGGLVEYGLGRTTVAKP